MRRAALHLALSAAALVTAWPFLWMVSTAFKGPLEAATPSLGLWPGVWHLENIAETFRAAPFGRYLFNSFLVSLTVSALVTLTSVCAGYAFARLRFPGRGLLFAATLCCMMVPFEAVFIPNFALVSRLGWYNTHAALIVPWCASAFSLFLARQAFLSLPGEYHDAARVDGCGHFRFLFLVGVPLIRPTVVTVALFAFLGSYNALLWPLLVTADDSMRVAQVGLTFFVTDAGIRVNLLMCASAIVILPTVALYFAAQRHFVESALGAGIKA
ncbi:MAG TPA: carbohydrate ABC transporter permease [Candidatus Hydrogenedentes bacterium]|nr:carbohydrate ABC transporter permease [Candidatus Hydrogenedentota bacterium]